MKVAWIFVWQQEEYNRYFQLSIAPESERFIRVDIVYAQAEISKRIESPACVFHCSIYSRCTQRRASGLALIGMRRVAPMRQGQEHVRVAEVPVQHTRLGSFSLEGKQGGGLLRVKCFDCLEQSRRTSISNSRSNEQFGICIRNTQSSLYDRNYCYVYASMGLEFNVLAPVVLPLVLDTT